MLAISVDGDRYTPAPTLDHLCAKLAGARIERMHLTEADAGVPLDHFRRVRASAAVADRVARWVRAMSQPPGTLLP